MLQDFIDKLPEDSREAFKAEIAGAVVIKDRSEAARLMKEHNLLKSAFDAEISYTAAAIEKRYQEEKLPKIVEEEIKRRGTKDPATLEIEKLRAELAEKDRQSVLKERRIQAVQKAAELGLPADIMEFAVDADEAAFNAKIEKLAGLKAWRDADVERIVKERYGNQKPPVGGASSGSDFSSMTLTEQMQYAARGPAEKQAILEWQKRKR